MASTNTRHLTILLDRNVNANAPTLALPQDVSTAAAITALVAFFEQQREWDVVRIEVGGLELGPSSRRHAAWLRSANARGVGDGDGASMHGVGQYRVLVYRCPTCQVRKAFVHIDAASVPSCPEGHGPLEYKP